tara:strand:+ start:349 stop:1083 length:735 start_codon:yes stop_codon:yes gene_type:complete
VDYLDQIIDEINKIEFKYIKINNSRGFKYRIYKKLRKLFFKNDLFNLKKNKFSSSDFLYLKKISLLKDYGHMSTPGVGLIINKICRKLKSDQIFLNIGAYKGFSTASGMINTMCEVHSVDNFSEFDAPKKVFYENFKLFKNSKHFFYEEDYELFFKKWRKKINFYIYDAHHSYKNQFNNLEIAKNFFKKDTLIYIDDFNVAEVENATRDFLARYSGEYEIIKEVKTAFNMHPTFWNGFILFKKN